MDVQTSIDLERFRELVPGLPAAALDEHLLLACQMIPGSSIHLGEPDPALADLTLADVTLIGEALTELARRGLDWRMS